MGKINGEAASFYSAGRRSSQHSDAANLLMLWAFLDNRDLWYELLAPALDLAVADEVPRWFAR